MVGTVVGVVVAGIVAAVVASVVGSVVVAAVVVAVVTAVVVGVVGVVGSSAVVPKAVVVGVVWAVVCRGVVCGAAVIVTETAAVVAVCKIAVVAVGDVTVCAETGASVALVIPTTGSSGAAKAQAESMATARASGRRREGKRTRLSAPFVTDGMDYSCSFRCKSSGLAAKRMASASEIVPFLQRAAKLASIEIMPSAADDAISASSW